MSSNFSVAPELPSGLEETITAKEIAQWLGINRSTIYRYVEQCNFPKPVKLSPRRQVFIKSAVVQWFQEKQKTDNQSEDPLSEFPEAKS